MDSDPNEQRGGQSAGRRNPAPKGGLPSRELNTGFRGGSCLPRQIRRRNGDFVRGFQVREYLLAALATRDVRFQGRHLLRSERTLVICSEGFRIRTCIARVAR